MSSITFNQLRTVLRRADAMSEPAECHGTLTGILCAGRAQLREAWIRATLEGRDLENAAVQESMDVLIEMHAETREQLSGEDLAFVPLLPDDEMPLGDRVQAMSVWCQGFLYGLGMADIGQLDELPPDVREVIEDFSEISRAAPAQGSDPEADESAYAELLEYIRVGAQLVHDEMNPARPAHFRAPPRLH